MGVAAYNRGTMGIRRQIDAESRPKLVALLESLTDAGESSGATVFAPTVVRIDEAGRAWLMNKKERGWGEFGYPYKTVRALAKDWRLFWSSVGRDDASFYYEVQPLPKGGAQ